MIPADAARTSAQTSYPPPPISAPPTQTTFTYPSPPPPQAGGGRSYYPPPPQVSTPPPPPPKSSTPFYPSPPAPPAQQTLIPMHTRTSSGLSQKTSSGRPQFAVPPTYSAPEERQDDGEYPAEKQQGAEQHLPSMGLGASASMIVGAPVSGQFVGASAVVDDVGTFNGGSYRISHRDSNTLLTIQLAIGCPLHAKPGKRGAFNGTRTWTGAITAALC